VVSHQACGLGGCHTNDHLARNRSRCASLSDIDNIAQCREVVVGCAEAGGSNECFAGVDSRSYRKGHRRRGIGLCRSLGQVDCGCYCCGRVMRPADAPEEQSNNFIAYDFVNDAVMSGDRSGCQLIEVVEECVEVDWAHSFSYGCRAAEIGKQQGDRYLYSGHVTFAKLGDAFGAERWIQGLLVPRLLEDEAT
jgi:hypothetical protein